MTKQLYAAQVRTLSALLCWLGLIGLVPSSVNASILDAGGPNELISAQAGFTGAYALSNFTLTNTNLNPSDPIPANGFAEITPAGSLVLTGSNTGSGLTPGATTHLTIASAGTGQVSFSWMYTSLDAPEFDIGGYILGNDFNVLADSDGQSGSISFPVGLGDRFGFGVRTIDNQGEPGILTITDFTAPAQTVIPEPGTSALMLLAVLGGIALRQYDSRKSSRGGNQ